MRAWHIWISPNVATFPTHKVVWFNDKPYAKGGEEMAKRVFEKLKGYIVAKTIPEPFPQAPNRAAKHELRFYYGENLERFGLHLFAQDYSASKFLETVIEGGKLTWNKDSEVTCELKDHVIVIKGKTLQDIFEYERTPSEDEWEIPEPYASYVNTIRTGTRQFEREDGNHGKSERKERSSTGRGVRADKPARESKPRASKEGLVTIQQICEEQGWDPRVARGVMRNLGWEKPAAGWAWPDNEAVSIRKKLIEGMKGKK